MWAFLLLVCVHALNALNHLASLPAPRTGLLSSYTLFRPHVPLLCFTQDVPSTSLCPPPPCIDVGISIEGTDDRVPVHGALAEQI